MKYDWEVAGESMRMFPPIFGSFKNVMIEYEGFTNSDSCGRDRNRRPFRPYWWCSCCNADQSLLFTVLK
ncbi:putative taxadiene 5-alpha-hydroxylase [Lupinus albus]|uniref:Putative taxadiene 5-alpha-hydroxylase n=1 Tax=Lupinus albus TaxID=3870 RepID=A0A6A4PNK2_LUPAL|nr:putative taxadiene 5-alpha-hydroxylase [Lupinus albus]